MATTDTNSTPAQPEDVEKYTAAQDAEYGTYVATGPIDLNGVRAYNEGHPVPVSNYKAMDTETKKLVRKV